MTEAATGKIDMKVTAKKGRAFYVRAALSFLKGVDAKEADGDKPAVEAKAPVEGLRISGLGEAISVVIAVATEVETAGLGSISKISTGYPTMEGSGRGCAQIIVDVERT